MALVGIVTDEDDDGNAASDQKTTTQKRPTPAPIPTAKPVNLVDAAPEIPYASSPEAQAKVDAKAQPAPLNDWIADPASRKYFWGQVKGLGMTTEMAHGVLKIERMGQFHGTLEEALDILRSAIGKPAELAPFSGEDTEHEGAIA